MILVPRGATTVPFEQPQQNPTKKVKTLMDDSMSKVDMAISALMRETGDSSHQPRPFAKFMFSSNNFDGMKFEISSTSNMMSQWML